MWDLNAVTRIEYRSGYSYLVVFDDGVQAVIDFSDYLDRGPVFAPLRDPRLFRQATIEGGTIAWPNGADIAPEALYEKCERAGAVGIRRRAFLQVLADHLLTNGPSADPG